MILGYCRVSSTEQVHGTSLDNQASVIRAYAQMRGLSTFDIQFFRDAGISGATRLGFRPGGEKLLEAAQKGDIVVASKLDRMFRSSTDALAVAEQFKEKGVDLVLLDLGIEPITGDGVSKFIFTIFAALANMERDRIRERCAEGRTVKRNRGGPVGKTPFGYRKVGQGKGATLELDAREIEAAQLARKNSKFPLRFIAADLAKQGFLARSGKPYSAERIKVMINMPLPA